MAALASSMQRLENAVARLEAAMESIEGLGQERQLLTDALASARADYDKLAVVAGTVAKRLDGTIGRIDAVLEK